VITPDFLFLLGQDERVDFLEQDLIEFKPYGMSLTNDALRPFLILKDIKGEHSLPVGISQIEAGLALTQSNSQGYPATPHKFAEVLLQSIDVEIERCVFTEIKGVHQYVRIYMKNHPRYQSVKLRAEEAMSLCLHMKVPIFATLSFIQKSKLMTAQVTGLAKTTTNNPELSALLAGKGTLCH